MKVLIPGSTGLVGRALVRSKPRNFDLILPTRRELNYEDMNEVSSFIKDQNPDAIILAAAKVGGIVANQKSQFDFLMANLRIQNAFMEGSVKSKIKNFIFLGSSCIYPKYADQPIKETELLTGKLESSNEGYAIAKIAGIKACRSIYEEFGYNYFSLMPTNLYGRNDNFDLSTSHVPAALMRKFHEARMLSSKTVDIWGTGKVYREFMHVDDLADACWYFLNHSSVGGELLNIGTGEDITIRDFAHLMAKITKYEGEFNFDASMPEGTPRKLLDINKAKSLGWESKISLVSGLEMTYSWFKEAYSNGEVRGF